MKAAIALVVTLLSLGQGACTAANDSYAGDGPGMGADLTGGGGGGGGGDGSGGGGNSDQGGALTCGQIQVQVTADLKASQSCQQDSDCTLALTACGLPGACGDYYANQSWRSAEVTALLKDWSTQACASAHCPCPAIFLPAPACNKGVCGPRTLPLAGLGAACTGDGECVTGQCVTESSDPSFVGGYCTVKDCAKSVCPMGSSCRGLSNGTQICLLDCSQSASTCRGGYACCSGPGPTRGSGWCAPAKSGLCLAV